MAMKNMLNTVYCYWLLFVLNIYNALNSQKIFSSVCNQSLNPSHESRPFYWFFVTNRKSRDSSAVSIMSATTAEAVGIWPAP